MDVIRSFSVEQLRSQSVPQRQPAQPLRGKSSKNWSRKTSYRSWINKYNEGYNPKFYLSSLILLTLTV
uniref:PH domain-containing protein n=1 Tax=Caenorhabditis tropicalis TaxID=1561998 RepID=A0A1I7UDU5_9PELO